MAVYNLDGTVVSAETPLIVAARKLGLHLMPNSEGELNAVRRARQMTDIKWKPCVNRYRGCIVEYDQTITVVEKVDDTFLADTEYTGIPYSRGDVRSSGMPAYGKDHGFVGFDVPLSAFATSVINPNTYFSTSDYHASGSSAAYTPYGVTCDTLVCYAWGFAQWYGSDTGFQTLLNNSTISLIGSADNIETIFPSVHLGDALWKKGVHVAIITDLFKDGNGNLLVEVSEATTRGLTEPDTIGGQKGGLSRRELWGMDTFFTRFGGYGIYRYADVDQIAYQQSPFVTLEGEEPMHNLKANLPLMPYMGDGFVYRVGKIPNSSVVLGTTGYAYLAVYKDGELFQTFTVNSASSVSVGFSAAGRYEAFLYDSSDGTVANMTARTVSCEWTVAA